MSDWLDWYVLSHAKRSVGSLLTRFVILVSLNDDSDSRWVRLGLSNLPVMIEAAVHVRANWAKLASIMGRSISGYGCG